ncbi:hypothetical protein [Hyphomicrobium sp.]|uniref:hypothetical protein n=1 Tax=Hyphomicrobium sp. TaxID=82 RepID=UPI003569A32E
MLAQQTDEDFKLSADEIEEKWVSVGEFVPSEKLKQAKDAPLKHGTVIFRTFVAGWGFGVVSYLAFLIAGVTIVWSSGMMSVAADRTDFLDPPKTVFDPKQISAAERE